MDSLIDRYLAERARELKVNGMKPRFLDEARQHLEESTTALELTGLPREEAEREAIARFGTPAEVADRYSEQAASQRGGWATQPWSRIAFASGVAAVVVVAGAIGGTYLLLSADDQNDAGTGEAQRDLVGNDSRDHAAEIDISSLPAELALHVGFSEVDSKEAEFVEDICEPNRPWYDSSRQPGALESAVWYTFRSQEDSRIRLFGGGSSFRPLFLVVDESGRATCEFGETGIDVVAGKTYEVMVASDYGHCEAPNPCRLILRLAKTPSNDLPDAATRITSQQFPFTETLDVTDAIGTEIRVDCVPEEPCELPPCAPFANSVWYSFTLDDGGWIHMDTFGSNFDLSMAIYPTDGDIPAPDDSPLEGQCGYGASEDGAATSHRNCHTQAQQCAMVADFLAAPGTTYYVAVGGQGPPFFPAGCPTEGCEVAINIQNPPVARGFRFYCDHSWQQPAFDSATLCVAPDWTFAPAVGADPSTLVSPDGHVRIAIHQGINPLVGQPCAEPHRTWGEGGPATVCIEDRGNQTVYRFLYDSLRYVELTVDDAYVDYLFQGQMLAMQVREQYSLPGGSPEQAVSHFVAGEVPQCASRAGSQPCLSEARATPEGNFLVSLLSAPGGETLAEYFVLSGTGGGGYLVDVSQSSVGTEPG